LVSAGGTQNGVPLGQGVGNAAKSHGEHSEERHSAGHVVGERYYQALFG
jgi:hypothetical protein